MIRNLRALGLAFVAVFAMSAIAATAASAETADFAASKYPAHVVAFTDEGIAHTFTSSIGTLTCVQSGESQPVDGTAILAKESPELTTESIVYTNCHATVLKLPVTVDMNGCDYLFTAGNMTTATTAEGSVHIVCPVGKQIEITIFSNKENHTKGIPGCIIDVEAQTPTKGVIKYTNITTGSGQKAVTVKAEGITVTSKRTAVGALCTAGNDQSVYNGPFIAEATEGVNLEMTGTK